MGKRIPFIHNYCDRWCERCYFTSSCGVFESMKDETDEQKDITNKAFWDNLASNLVKGNEMLVEGAKNFGMSLEISETEMARLHEEMEQQRMLVREDLLMVMCRQYSVGAARIMKNTEFWKTKGDEMIEQERLGTVAAQELEDQLELMKECREVINWYYFFIQLKFERALSGLLDDLYEKNEIQTDYNGSAKIALIAVNRSLQAWTELFTLFPDEDNILPILSLLTQIQQLGTEKFPQAKNFVRPGFDQPEVFP